MGRMWQRWTLWDRSLTAIIRVGHPHAAAYDAPPLEGAVIALVANVHDGGGIDEGIADDALPVALLAEAADGDARLLPAHDQVGVVLGHLVGAEWRERRRNAGARRQESGLA